MRMEQSVPKCRHIKFRRRGITQKKVYNKLMTVSVTEPVIQTLGNNPEESIQHSEHGKCMKSRIIPVILKDREVSGKVTAIVRFLNCLENVDCFLISLNYKKYVQQIAIYGCPKICSKLRQEITHTHTHTQEEKQNTKIGTGALLPGVKRPEHEADHSPSSAKVMNAWSYTSILLCAFKAECSLMQGTTSLFFTKLKQKITFINESFYLTRCNYTLDELTFLSPDRLMGGG